MTMIDEDRLRSAARRGGRRPSPSPTGRPNGSCLAASEDARPGGRRALHRPPAAVGVGRRSWRRPWSSWPGVWPSSADRRVRVTAIAPRPGPRWRRRAGRPPSADDHRPVPHRGVVRRRRRPPGRPAGSRRRLERQPAQPAPAPAGSGDHVPGAAAPGRRRTAGQGGDHRLGRPGPRQRLARRRGHPADHGRDRGGRLRGEVPACRSVPRRRERPSSGTVVLQVPQASFADRAHPGAGDRQGHVDDVDLDRRHRPVRRPPGPDRRPPGEPAAVPDDSVQGHLDRRHPGRPEPARLHPEPDRATAGPAQPPEQPDDLRHVDGSLSQPGHARSPAARRRSRASVGPGTSRSAASRPGSSGWSGSPGARCSCSCAWPCWPSPAGGRGAWGDARCSDGRGQVTISWTVAVLAEASLTVTT